METMRLWIISTDIKRLWITLIDITRRWITIMDITRSGYGLRSNKFFFPTAERFNFKHTSNASTVKDEDDRAQDLLFSNFHLNICFNLFTYFEFES